MIDERKEAQASLYVVGALPPDEARDFERALPADLELQLLVTELRAAADVMVAAFPRVAPPPDLKQRIMEEIDAGDTTGNTIPLREADFGNWLYWVPWALAACFAILCVVLIGTGASLRRQMAGLRQQIDQVSEATNESEQQQRQQVQTIIQQVTNYQQRAADLQTQLAQRAQDYQRDTTRLYDQLKQATNRLQFQRVPLLRQLEEQQDLIDELQDAISQVTVPSSDRFSQVRLLSLVPTTNGPAGSAGAAAFDLVSQQGSVDVQNLPPLANGDYQFWLFDPRYITPVSGGVFSTDAQGHTQYQFRSSVPIAAVVAFAISIERKGGAPTPTPNRVVMTSN